MWVTLMILHHQIYEHTQMELMRLCLTTDSKLPSFTRDWIVLHTGKLFMIVFEETEREYAALKKCNLLMTQ